MKQQFPYLEKLAIHCKLSEIQTTSFKEALEKFGFVAAHFLHRNTSPEYSIQFLKNIETALQILNCNNTKIDRLFKKEFADSMHAEILITASLTTLFKEKLCYELETTTGKQPDITIPDLNIVFEIRFLDEWQPSKTKKKFNHDFANLIKSEIKNINSINFGYEIKINTSETYDNETSLSFAKEIANQVSQLKHSGLPVKYKSCRACISKGENTKIQKSLGFRVKTSTDNIVSIGGATVTPVTGSYAKEIAKEENNKNEPITVAHSPDGKSLVDHIRTKITEKHKQLHKEKKNIVVIISRTDIEPSIHDWNFLLPQVWSGDELLIIPIVDGKMSNNYSLTNFEETSLSNGVIPYENLHGVWGVTITGFGDIVSMSFQKKPDVKFDNFDKIQKKLEFQGNLLDLWKDESIFSKFT